MTKSGAAAPGPNDVDDHVVAVAARAALVDDTRAGHAEAHGERRRGEQEQQGQTGDQGPARVAQGEAGPAGPAALGGAVGVVVALGDQDPVAQGDQHGRQQGERGQGHGHDGEDHAERHRRGTP